MQYRASSSQLNMMQTTMNTFCNFKKGWLILITFILLYVLYTRYHRTPEIDPFQVHVDNKTCKSSRDDYQSMAHILRTQHLIPPDYTVPYNLSWYTMYEMSMAQITVVRRILKNKRNGFFVEVGAFNGEGASNTLTLEKDLNWTGLLMEPSPENFEFLQSRHRRAYISRSCVSAAPCVQELKFNSEDTRGRLVDESDKRTSVVTATCFPLYAYLLAVNRMTVDYFSLDVEGQEFAILKTIPWDKVDIKVLSVENFQIPEGKQALRSYMESVGYTLHSKMTIGQYWAWDDIYVKTSFL